MINKLTVYLLGMFSLLGCLAVQGQTRLNDLSPPGVASLFEPANMGLAAVRVDFNTPPSFLSRFKREVTLDSTQQYVTIEEKLFDYDYRLPVTVQIDHYIAARMKYQVRLTWNKVAREVAGPIDTGDGNGIELNIPVRIRSKAFRRIFGGDRVGLRVSGNISFELAGRTESREGSAVSSIEERGNFSPKFKQTQQFRVEGRVGDKVTVSVDQNSEATFDFENTLKLTYTGDEDEIIQKIEAGNVSLSLPSTNYVSTSSNHQGLFGVKSEARVGNFSFTGIASLQRGENEKLSLSGANRENTFRVKDIDFVKNRFFFMDDVYREAWEGSINETSWSLTINPLNKIQQLDVWRTEVGSFNYDETFDGFAVLDPNSILEGIANGTVTLDSLDEIPGAIETGRFKRLEPDIDYSFDFQRGYLWLNSIPSSNEVIAIAYSRGESSSSTTDVGQLWQDIPVDTSGSNNTQIVLKLLKPRNLQPDYATWNLSMRNVYSLGPSGISADGFNLNVLYSVTGEDGEVDPASGKTFNNRMGLDRVNEQQAVQEGGDRKPDVSKPFVFDLANGYLFFPSLTPFQPLGSDRYGFDENLYVDIYNTNNQTLQQTESKFEIEVTTTSGSSTFDLGFNVLEGSEKVRLNGRELSRDQDYIIDYFSGTLEITAPEGRRADAQVEIEYERGALFQLDKKTLLGGRLEYKFGESNFVGLTTMYYSKSTLDQRVRLGQEPIRNLIWDLNTAINFEPNFITKALDALPVVETSAESKLKIEAEIAQVKPNPNTFNESGLGEDQGVAYIDDFEGAERFTSLGVQYRVWSAASAPAKFNIIGELDTLSKDLFFSNEEYVKFMDSTRIQLNWYNPFNPVRTTSIFPNKEVNSQTGTTTTVLNLRWRNDDISRENAWAGVMRSTASFADQQKTKFIELWVKGDSGQVNVDIGRISEDWWVRGEFPDPNAQVIAGQPEDEIPTIPSFGNLNNEDKNLNGLLDDLLGEDTGIDGWLNGQAGDAGELDDWAPVRNTNPAFAKINGTEGNSQQQGAKYPDTEDLDGDGALNKFNDYFTYSIDLSDQESPFWVSSTFDDGGPTGWRLFRIPLKEYNYKVGDPDTSFQEVLFSRLWINNIRPSAAEYDSIQIATFDFVGNEWEEIGWARSDDSPLRIDETKFGITIANDEETDNYLSPPGVSGIRDRITRVTSKEQSLVMQLTDLPGGSRAEAKKQFREAINLLNYKNMRMFVRGNQDLMDDDSLWFYIRFGPTESIYYEYSQLVRRGENYTDNESGDRGWAIENNIDINFEELAITKNPEFLVSDADDVDNPVFMREDPNFPGKYFKVVGRPGLHNINFMVIGARNGRPRGNVRSRNDFGLNRLIDQEIWLDELRVTGVERESGVAMRLATDLQMADVASFRAQWEVIDDDFRKIEQQFASPNGKDQTQEKQSYFASLRLHKFLPESWGLELPIDGRYTRTRNIPKYFYNTDQRTNYDPQNRLQQFFGMGSIDDTLANQVTLTETKSVGGTFRRPDKQRDPWYLRYTVNQVVVDTDYSLSTNTSPTTAFNNKETISGRLSFKIPWPKDKFIKPFGWMGESKIARLLSGQKLYYLPQTSDFNMTLNDTETEQRNRLEPDSVATIPTIAVNSTRKFSLKYKLLEKLNLDISRDYQSDARIDEHGNPIDRRASDLIDEIVSRGDFGTDMKTTQRFNLSYSPELFSWLGGSYRYGANYIFSFDNPAINARSATLNVDKNMHFDFKPSTLVNAIYKPKSSATSGRGARNRPTRPGQRRSQDGEEEADQEGKEDEAKKGGVGVPNPLMLVWHFFDTFKNISIDVRRQDSYADANLTTPPVWRYQFGLQAETESGIDTTFDKLILPQNVRRTEGIDASTQIDILRNVSANLKYNSSETFNDVNEQRTQNLSNSIFFRGDDPDSSRQGWWDFIPDWTVNVSGIEKLPFIKEVTTSATIQHGRSGKYTEATRFENIVDEVSGDVIGDSLIPESRTYTNSYQPLIGLTISTKWGVSINARSTRSTTIDIRTAGATSKRIQSGFNLSASYSVTKGFRLPIPFLKNLKLDNEVQFSLAFDKTDNTNFSKNASETEFQELDVNNTWKLRPSVTYRFSQKVNGSAHWEQSSSFNKRTGTTSYKEFGITVNIAIR